MQIKDDFDQKKTAIVFVKPKTFKALTHYPL